MGDINPHRPKEGPFLLAGDIGGTKTNIGLFTIAPSGPCLYTEATYASSQVNNLEEMIEDLLNKHPVALAAACFGIAGPVIDGVAHLTNLSWSVSEANLRQRLGCNRISLINDLTATALAVPLLGRDVLTPLNDVPVKKRGNMALVAPGTGLGQALLLHERGDYRPIASEGGHSDFAPTDETEVNLWHFLNKRYGHVSIERTLSGAGLLNIYLWLAHNQPGLASDEVNRALQNPESQDPARVITRLALEGGESLCSKTLTHYCRILGAVTGNLALTAMATGGVFLGGGIPPKILPILEKSDFMRRFCAKGRFSDLLAAIPVWVIRNDKAALLGAARMALTLFTQPPERATP